MLYLLKKMAIVIIGITVSYILYKVLFDPPELLEMFEAATKKQLKTVSDVKNKLPLREYCVKSSYNSALTEKNIIDASNVKFILSRGCRFLDFEIFLIDDAAQVAFSTDSNFTTVASKNYIPLNEILKHVIMHGFSAPSPNMNDPLFIQFRIKTKSSELYNLIGMSVKKYLENLLVHGKVTGDTKLETLMGKVVLIIDASSSPGYANNDYYSGCSNTIESQETSPIRVFNDKTECYNLSHYANIESGTSELRIHTYDNLMRQTITPPTIIDSDEPNTDVALLRIVVPDASNTGNPDAMEFISQYGVQFIPNRFYIKDSNLAAYETIFSENNSAFVPMIDFIHSSKFM